jgi:hypothetical protein
VPAVALLRLVLADPDLLAERRGNHLRRHLDARREVRLGVAAAREEDVGMEGLAFVRRQTVNEQPVALADAVLLASQ